MNSFETALFITQTSVSAIAVSVLACGWIRSHRNAHALKSDLEKLHKQSQSKLFCHTFIASQNDELHRQVNNARRGCQKLNIENENLKVQNEALKSSIESTKKALEILQARADVLETISGVEISTVNDCSDDEDAVFEKDKFVQELNGIVESINKKNNKKNNK